LDITGKAVIFRKIAINAHQSELNLHGLASGVYQLVWTDGMLILSRTFFVR
jgi:hypothetical protein